MAFPESGDYWFPGGLAPVTIAREADRGSYWEPKAAGPKGSDCLVPTGSSTSGATQPRNVAGTSAVAALIAAGYSSAPLGLLWP
jgi:hypothetical protein